MAQQSRRARPLLGYPAARYPPLSSLLHQGPLSPFARACACEGRSVGSTSASFSPKSLPVIPMACERMGRTRAAHALGKGHCMWASRRSHFTAIIELESRGQGSGAPVEALEQEVPALLGQHLGDHRRLLGRRDVEQRRHLSCMQRTPCYELQFLFYTLTGALISTVTVFLKSLDLHIYTRYLYKASF